MRYATSCCNVINPVNNTGPALGVWSPTPAVSLFRRGEVGSAAFENSVEAMRESDPLRLHPRRAMPPGHERPGGRFPLSQREGN